MITKGQKRKINFPPLRDTVDGEKEVWTIFGEKGVGKTVAALGITDGKIYALSFDGMTNRVRMNQMYDKKDNIVIYTPTAPDPENEWEGWVRTEERITESSSNVFDYAIYILEEIAKKGDCDTLVIDGLEMLFEICEMKMRYNGKLGPMDGIRNMNLWKLRKLYFENLFNKSMLAANNKVVFTTYTKFYEYEEDGVIIKKKRAKYADMTEWKSDIVLEITSEMSRDQTKSLATGKVIPAKFYARFYSNKLDRKYPPTGTKIDFTNKYLIDAIKEAKENGN